MDKKSKSSEKSEEIGDTAEMYEHITKEEESKAQAIDIASKEQAEIRTAEKQSENDNDFEEEVIDLSSDEEEPCNKSAGESLKTSQGRKKPGERGNFIIHISSFMLTENIYSDLLYILLNLSLCIKVYDKLCCKKNSVLMSKC